MKKTTYKYRLLSLLLALVLMSVLPITATATDSNATLGQEGIESVSTPLLLPDATVVEIPQPSETVISAIEQTYCNTYMTDDCHDHSVSDVESYVYWWQDGTYVLHIGVHWNPIPMSYEIVANHEFLFCVEADYLVYEDGVFYSLAQAYELQMISETQLSTLYTNYRARHASLYAEYSPEKQIFEYDVNSQFNLNEIVAYIRPFAKDTAFTPYDFSEIECVDVWKSVMNRYLIITIDGIVKQDVLDAITLIEDRCEFELIRPRFYFYSSQTEVETGSLNTVATAAASLATPANQNDSVLPSEIDEAFFNQQWALQNINAIDAWDVTTGSSNVYVGVIDSGIDVTHPDLVGKVDTELSQTFVPSGASPFEDDYCHGTTVASIIAANWGNNGEGIAGICQNVKLVSLRIQGADGDALYFEQLAEAICYAEEKRIPILNCSNGSYAGDVFDIMNDFDSIEAYQAVVAECETVINSYSGLIVCAVGNGYDNENSGAFVVPNVDVEPIYPACYSLSNIISVGAITSNGQKWASSSYGAQTVDLFAPGADIIGAFPTEYCTQTCVPALADPENLAHAAISAVHVVSGYHRGSGTSFAAPHVTGVAALILSVNPYLNGEELRTILMETATPDSNLTGLCVTGGRLNAGAALNFSYYQCLDIDFHNQYNATTGTYDFRYHTFDRYVANSDGTHSSYCACGQFGSASAHQSVQVISDTYHANRCTVCGDVYGETSHSFGYIASSSSAHYAYCTVCNYTKSEAHSYDAYYERIDHIEHHAYCACEESVVEEHLFFDDPNINPCPCGAYD